MYFTYLVTLSHVSLSASYVDSQLQILLEANFANETGLVALDLVELFSCHFRVCRYHNDITKHKNCICSVSTSCTYCCSISLQFNLERDEGNNILMNKVIILLLV